MHIIHKGAGGGEGGQEVCVCGGGGRALVL